MPLKSEELSFLRELQKKLNKQPTLATADPRYWVIMDYEEVPVSAEDVMLDAVSSVEVTDGYCEERMSVDDFIVAAWEAHRDIYGDESFTSWAPWCFARSSDGGIYLVADASILDLENVRMKYVEDTGNDAKLCQLRPTVAEGTLFLTLREATEHLKANYYHYHPRAHTYCMHAWRSPQVERLIEILHTADFSEEV